MLKCVSKSQLIAISLVSLIGMLSLWHWQSKQVDYSNLENLLSNHNWMEADKETSRIIGKLLLKTLDDETFFGYSRLDISGDRSWKILRKKLPCGDLQTVDQLWLKYSDGQFGFSAQAQLEQSVREHSSQSAEWEIIKDFVKQLGWEPSQSFRTLEWYKPTQNPKRARGFLPSYIWVADNSSVGKKGSGGSVLGTLEHFRNCTNAK